VTTEGERIATLEALVAGMRGDVTELRDETLGARRRLHKLEGLASTLVDQEKRRNIDTERHEKRVNRNLQLLAVVVALAAVLEPFLYHLTVGG
jgi:hypothetical protein